MARPSNRWYGSSSHKWLCPSGQSTISVVIIVAPSPPPSPGERLTNCLHPTLFSSYRLCPELHMSYRNDQRVPSTTLRCVSDSPPTHCTRHEFPVPFSSQSSTSWLSLAALPSYVIHTLHVHPSLQPTYFSPHLHPISLMNSVAPN